MSDMERKAVLAVTLSKEIRRIERQLEVLEREGKSDPQKELILKNLKQELDGKI